MRVVVAEDSVLLREGLARLLTEAGHEVEAATGDAEEFLREVDAHRPDVVVVDVRMPPTFTDEGLRAALVVRSTWPGVGVLVLSQYVEERYATELLSDRPQGVGYLLKDRVADLTEFLDALERVAAGGQRPRSRGGRAAARAQPSSAGCPHAAGTGRARPDGGGPVQRRDRRRAGGQ